MKIVSWNCNGALRKKLEVADSLEADLLIIQECENPALQSLEYKEWAGNYLWCGTNKNKGIGIFPKNGHAIEQLSWNNSFSIGNLRYPNSAQSWKTEDLKLFLPFRVNDKFNVLGVWTKGERDEPFRYIGQLWKFLQIHHKELTSSETMIIGDFNSNAIWDRRDCWWSHTDVVHELEEMNIFSLYHYFMKEEQGKETIPTYFMYRKLSKGYHIDYAFISKSLFDKCSMEFCSIEDWIEFSDHIPIVVLTDD